MYPRGLGSSFQEYPLMWAILSKLFKLSYLKLSKLSQVYAFFKKTQDSGPWWIYIERAGISEEGGEL